MKTQQPLPSLQSEIIGELDEDAGLVYFRGIPYASVEKRWTHSRTRHSLESPFDATKFGPRCVQAVGEVLVSGGVNDPVPGDDEFKCLNLNITVPNEILKQYENGYAKSLLPVMVWIHGYVDALSLILTFLTALRGGFNFGANSVARYRPKILSSLAKQAGHPIVLVQIGYRLGVFGFAASHDLDSELAPAPTTNGCNGHTSQPYLGNYGMVDQRNALEWVQDHIRDFGGDPSNVTAFGISAGSASVHYHILTGTPLFDRAICMSGSAPTIGPLPFEFYESAWQNLCEKAGAQDDTAVGRLESLRAMNPEDIIQNYTSAAMGPMADGKLLPSSWDLGEEQPPTRCKAIILGDTRVEGIVIDGLSRQIPQARFHELILSAFSAADAEDFSKHFGFTSEDLPYEAYRDAVRKFLSVAMFHFPNLRITETYGQAGDAYLYHFEEPSPYPGPTFGLPYHGQCALYMYNNESDTYSVGGRHTAVEMALMWTAFAHGKQPWEAYSKSKGFMRFGPDGDVAMKEMKNDDTRDYGYVEWLRGHFEPVKEFAQQLLQGR
jgi:carboxylesterase type B